MKTIGEMMIDVEKFSLSSSPGKLSTYIQYPSPSYQHHHVDNFSNRQWI
jgi:hypothetical protein